MKETARTTPWTHKGRSHRERAGQALPRPADQETDMRRVLALLCLLALPVAAQEYKIAVVSMLHAHVWLHLGTMLEGKNARLVGVAETLPELLERAKRTDQIPQSQNTRPG